MGPLDTIRFYFSFRSPYAWLAAEHWDEALGPLAERVELLPFYPTTETFPNDPVRVPIRDAAVRAEVDQGLVYRGQLFWGHDRLTFLKEAVAAHEQASGTP